MRRTIASLPSSPTAINATPTIQAMISLHIATEYIPLTPSQAQGPTNSKKRRAADNTHSTPSQARLCKALLPPSTIRDPPACFTHSPTIPHNLDNMSDPTPNPHLMDSEPLATEQDLFPPLQPAHLPNHTLHVTRGKKISTTANKLPTRRSQRLQQKFSPHSSLSKRSEKTNARTAKLAFDLDFSETPLDSATTLALLQASGVTITEQIEQMIDQAAAQDKDDAADDLPLPTTLLHDLIPPFQMPGDDMLL